MGRHRVRGSWKLAGLCTAIVAASASVLAVSAPQVPLTTAFSLGDVHKPDALDLVRSLDRAWQSSGSLINSNKLGLLPMLLLSSPRPAFWPYFGNPAPFELDRTIFLNLGKTGYLIGEAEAPRLVQRSALLTRWMVGRFRGPLETQAPFADNDTVLPENFGLLEEAVSLVLGPRPPAARCKPKGVLPRFGAGRIPLGQDAFCIHSRSPLDERRTKSGSNRISSLVCLDPRTMRFLDSDLRESSVVLPQPDGSVIVFEDRYVPPHVSVIDPLTFRVQSFQREANSLFKNSRAKGVTLPTDRDFGFYHCPSIQTWAAVDSDIFSGRRALRSDEDGAYLFQLDPSAGLNASRITWSELQENFPDIDRFPSPWCVFDAAIDVKCAIQMLNRAGWVASFALSHEHPPQGRLARDVFALNYFLLKRVLEKLPDWLLRRETEQMATLFYNEMMRNNRDFGLDELTDPGFQAIEVPSETEEDIRMRSRERLSSFLDFPDHERILQLMGNK